jgi:hypothetical protein
MLNFVIVSSLHSEKELSDAISLCLSNWNLKDRLFTITLDDDFSSHDIYSANLGDNILNKYTLMFKGVRCYTHILNVVAQDLIASFHGIVYNIRESIKFLKASSIHKKKFYEISLQHQIPSTEFLPLEMETQWC